MRKIIFALVLSLFATESLALSPLDTKAKQALVMDYDTGAVMYEKSADELMPPASMSKLMTAYLIFDKLKAGVLKETDEFKMSENAYRKTGAARNPGISSMFIEYNQSVKLSDLIQGIIVVSGNDACLVAAEGISGSEENFVAEMNILSREIGLKKSVFKNVSGLYHPEHLMTAYDLAILAKAIIDDFPEYYKIYSQKEFAFGVDRKTGKAISQPNRNPLLQANILGADGLKTGYLSKAGYGFTGSVKRGNRRIIFVLNGMGSNAIRSQESRKVAEWAFREFDNYQVFKKGDVIGEGKVWFGKQDLVGLEVGEDAVITLPRGEQRKIKAEIEYEEPLSAPLIRGRKAGKVVLFVEGDEKSRRELPLYVSSDVEAVGVFGRLYENIKQILLRIF